MEATAKSENGSSVPGVQTKGTTSANYSETQEDIKPCPYRYCGCISQNGYMCTLGKPCDPCDEHGHKFRMVKVVTADGHEIWGRDFRLIDIDTLQAAATVREAEAAIAGTPFADAVPFNPTEFVNDIVGS
jgi:hypothetical protein